MRAWRAAAVCWHWNRWFLRPRILFSDKPCSWLWMLAIARNCMTVLETELRMRERQGETDAKTLEVAGGFAPTIGIIGTVVGLIEVMRHFSNLQSVGFGIGTAFVSTIYGLALAKLLLLPAAHRIRARVAENFEIQEMIIEGVLSLTDHVHPALIRLRLSAYMRQRDVQLPRRGNLGGA